MTALYALGAFPIVTAVLMSIAAELMERKER